MEVRQPTIGTKLSAMTLNVKSDLSMSNAPPPTSIKSVMKRTRTVPKNILTPSMSNIPLAIKSPE
uniref:Uncharacterized protein n=1 Tax=Rhizobium leguminosarum TaxID=384 RepID=A0A154IF07_RHILE|nr:hypothetical protein A4A59_26430 [Rhizobium leguminosarum]